MDISKLIELLQQYPYWFRALVMLWLIAGAALAGGLFIFRVGTPIPFISSAPPVPPEALTKNTASSEPKNLSLEHSSSPDEYASRLRALSDRFLETHEFVAAHQGAEVEWDGLVDRVSEHTRSKQVHLLLTTQSISPEMSVLVVLPDSLRTKAFSLRRGDLIRVKGKLELSTPNLPDIDASHLIVLKAKSGG